MLCGKKVIGFIPLKSTSQRCKNKNLRYLNKHLLPSYMIQAAIESRIFDEIYINSSDEVFRELAENSGVGFYKRPAYLDEAHLSHEGFVPDFCRNIPCDVVFMLHSTSPFIQPETIRKAVDDMIAQDYDSIFSSIKEKQLYIFRDEPVNFQISEPYTQSQRVEPIREICWGVTGWKVKTLLDYADRGKALTFVGRVGYIELSKIEAIDIDYEEDFQLAEMVAYARQSLASGVSFQDRA